MSKIINDRFGPYPDEFFENDPLPEKPSKELMEWRKKIKEHGGDKYKPGDVAGGC